jgi:hypothetical protein
MLLLLRKKNKKACCGPELLGERSGSAQACQKK